MGFGKIGESLKLYRNLYIESIFGKELLHDFLKMFYGQQQMILQWLPFKIVFSFILLAIHFFVPDCLSS